MDGHEKINRGNGPLRRALILFCVIFRLASAGAYTVRVPLTPEREEALRRGGVRMMAGASEGLHGELEVRDGCIRVPVHPDRPGETFLVFRDQDGKEAGSVFLRVDRRGTVYDLSSGDFIGDSAVLVAVAAFWLAVTGIMLRHFLHAKGPAVYSYATIFFADFFIFALVTALVMLNMAVRHVMDPRLSSASPPVTPSAPAATMPAVISPAFFRNSDGSCSLPYKGSFDRAYPYANAAEAREILRRVLRHEFRHHLEFLAGIHDALSLGAGMREKKESTWLGAAQPPTHSHSKQNNQFGGN